MDTGFKERLLDLMKTHGITTQYRLSKKLKIRPNITNNWFTDKASCPRDKYLKRIADLFGVSMSWLRYGEEKDSPTLSTEATALASEIEKHGNDAVKMCRKFIRTFFDGESDHTQHHPISEEKESPKKRRTA